MEKQFYKQRKEKIRGILGSSDKKIKKFNSPFYTPYIEKRVNKIINYTNMRLN